MVGSSAVYAYGSGGSSCAIFTSSKVCAIFVSSKVLEMTGCGWKIHWGRAWLSLRPLIFVTLCARPPLVPSVTNTEAACSQGENTICSRSPAIVGCPSDFWNSNSVRRWISRLTVHADLGLATVGQPSGGILEQFVKKILDGAD